MGQTGLASGPLAGRLNLTRPMAGHVSEFGRQPEHRAACILGGALCVEIGQPFQSVCPALIASAGGTGHFPFKTDNFRADGTEIWRIGAVDRR